VTLKYAKNAFAAGAPSRPPLGELTTFPQTPSRPNTSRRRASTLAFGARQPATPSLVFWQIEHWPRVTYPILSLSMGPGALITC